MIIVRVIAGGGDGTVSTVINLMNEWKVDFSRCPIGCIPLGTGNDFSRSLGWQEVLNIEPNFQFLTQFTKKWVAAKMLPFDVWNIEVQLRKVTNH
jgi:diacylglycerol kinase (ATP)